MSSADKDKTSGRSAVSDYASILYEGWMTGYSYEACRRLYFPEEYTPDKQGTKRPEELRKNLVEWVYSYLNLVQGWDATGLDDTVKDLEAMAGDGGGRRTVGLARFDDDFTKVAGAVRAKAAYASYAVQFGADCARLRYPRAKNGTLLSTASLDATVTPDLVDRADTIGQLRMTLSKMRHILPPGAFSLIDNDLSAPLQPTSPRPDGKSGGHRFKPNPLVVSDERIEDRIQAWSELIFGTSTVEEILNDTGRGIYHLLVVLIALGLFAAVGGVIVLIFFGIQQLPGFDLSSLNITSTNSLVSSLRTIVATLASVGLSLSLMASRAWGGIKALEPWMAIQLARYERLRRPVIYPHKMPAPRRDSDQPSNV